MTLRYKLQKFRDKWNDGYFKPRFTNPDSTERQQAKKDIEEGLSDYLDIDDRTLRSEIQYEEEIRIANNCYLMELADPDYKCTCFEEKDNDIS